MQVSSPHLVPPSFLFGTQSDEVFTSKLEQDLKVKAKLTEEVSLTTCEENGEDSCLPEVDNHGSESDNDDFSFVCTNPDGSPISADDIFHNGQIRPVFPLFNSDLLFSDDGESAFEAKSETSAASLRPPLRKLFFEERDQDSPSSSSETDEPEGPFCSWKGKAMEASPEVCKKSNSTGFSKLWRFREFVARSNSDGKDAFVFLNPSHKNPSTTSKTTTTSPETESTYTRAEKSVKGVEKRKVVGKRGKSGGQTASSAHERHYVRNRAMKEADKRKSYLPYRQDLFGFFTNVNGLTRDVHPF